MEAAGYSVLTPDIDSLDRASSHEYKLDSATWLRSTVVVALD